MSPSFVHPVYLSHWLDVILFPVQAAVLQASSDLPWCHSALSELFQIAGWFLGTVEVSN